MYEFHIFQLHLYCVFKLLLVSLLAEDELVRTQLQRLDVPVQVTQHVNPLQVHPARTLSSMYQQLGENKLYYKVTIDGVKKNTPYHSGIEKPFSVSLS